MYEAKASLPVVMDVPGVKNQLSKWGEMNVSRMQLAKGVDFTPMLKGLPDDLCQCPHWGYVLKGALHVRYGDDHEEVIRAGQLYYLPPGHTAWVDEDIDVVEFSPSEQHDAVLKHLAGQ